MTKRPRFTYKPVTVGWVTVSDMRSSVLWQSPKCNGNAQEVLAAKLGELKRQGWTFEGDVNYDSVFAHRGRERVHVSIHRRDPKAPFEIRPPIQRPLQTKPKADMKAAPSNNVRSIEAARSIADACHNTYASTD